MRILLLAFVVVTFSILSLVNCFIPDGAKNIGLISRVDNEKKQQQSSSILHASMPPMIIGPMIRKIKAANEKKKLPMADQAESQNEAAGLRVGGKSWKWPPVWPYDQGTFEAFADVEQAQAAEKRKALASLASGGMTQQLPGDDAPVPAEDDTITKFDPIKFWGEEVATEATDISSEAVYNLKSHYAFYLKDGMSILELGAAEQSYMPDSLKLERHVGIGLSQKMMDKNPSLTENYSVNLNDVEEEKGVKSEALRQLSSKPFDAIVMANTVDFLTNPREVFKSCWYLLKPGGTMIVPFMNKEAYKDTFGKAQTKMWNTYNDDQHMWVLGSLFQFSAGEGWANLRGFDISPDDAKSIDNQGPLSFLQGGKNGKNTNMFVVQADRAAQDEDISTEDPEQSFKSKMWMLPTMESRDKQLIAPRLKRAYEQINDPDYLGKQVEYLPVIYESLIKMDQFSFTFNMQAQLATNLVTDTAFCGNEEQILALKQGLGLRKASKEFWEPVGRLTGAMDAEDKINLLTYIVPRFGSGDAKQEAALDAFVNGMQPTFSYIKERFPELQAADVQLLGTELLASELLQSHQHRVSPEKFAAWLGVMENQELLTILEDRKRIKQDAVSDLKQFREIKAELKRKEEEKQEKLKNQLETARKERTLDFNPGTGSFVVAEKPKE